jgi:hypothetical protein
VGDIDLKMISATKSSNKFQKTRFWKEKSVENVVTLEGLSFNSNMISFHIWLFKKLIHTLQNNVHMLSFPILFTLGPTTHATLSSMMSNLGSLCEKVSLITIDLLGNACL